jgi:hypothetical protein
VIPDLARIVVLARYKKLNLIVSSPLLVAKASLEYGPE